MDEDSYWCEYCTTISLCGPRKSYTYLPAARFPCDRRSTNCRLPLSPLPGYSIPPESSYANRESERRLKFSTVRRENTQGEAGTPYLLSSERDSGSDIPLVPHPIVVITPTSNSHFLHATKPRCGWNVPVQHDDTVAPPVRGIVPLRDESGNSKSPGLAPRNIHTNPLTPRATRVFWSDGTRRLGHGIDCKPNYR